MVEASHLAEEPANVAATGSEGAEEDADSAR
jgi:hypothetical protein